MPALVIDEHHRVLGAPECFPEESGPTGLRFRPRLAAHPVLGDSAVVLAPVNGVHLCPHRMRAGLWLGDPPGAASRGWSPPVDMWCSPTCVWPSPGARLARVGKLAPSPVFRTPLSAAVPRAARTLAGRFTVALLAGAAVAWMVSACGSASVSTLTKHAEQAASSIASKVQTGLTASGTEVADTTTTPTSTSTTTTTTTATATTTTTLSSTTTVTKTAAAPPVTTNNHTTTTVTAPPTSPAANSSSGVPWWGWVLIALGAVAVAIGLFLLGRGSGGGGRPKPHPRTSTPRPH